ncbi:HNH endonuclease [Pseudomonas phage 201phi2-1]|uniref:AP2/ERF domain-containing protein n=1 Tax=Pseudomonas phage 201phi2-1 TaxID=198110 RepID=B3FK10_BP201|nr:HNH endonuclease [Pseudomonas phage 201phi2-1]ABY62868.1 hypothetical protein 201phi2-1p035 [Pseudomonas phage 201phi2-1]
MAFRNFAGEKYGKLTVLSLSHKVEKGDRIWDCECECGTIVKRAGSTLLRSNNASCGCDRYNNLIGTRYGRLLALGRVTKIGEPLKWKCRCDCGVVLTVLATSLKSGRTKSCGCLRDEATSVRMKTHGKSKTPVWHVWVAMCQRCRTDETGHPEYGGRGIKVCDEWLKSFEAFYAHVGDRPKGMTIDRIDVDGDYEPSNVRWATVSTQNINQRTRKDNSTGVKGVSKRSNGKYQAKLNINGKTILQKEFDTIDEAIKARQCAEEVYHKPLLDAK